MLSEIRRVGRGTPSTSGTRFAKGSEIGAPGERGLTEDLVLRDIAGDKEGLFRTLWRTGTRRAIVKSGVQEPVQAATWLSEFTSIPSLNLTPVITFAR